MIQDKLSKTQRCFHAFVNATKFLLNVQQQFPQNINHLLNIFSQKAWSSHHYRSWYSRVKRCKTAVIIWNGLYYIRGKGMSVHMIFFLGIFHINTCYCRSCRSDCTKHAVCFLHILMQKKNSDSTFPFFFLFHFQSEKYKFVEHACSEWDIVICYVHTQLFLALYMFVFILNGFPCGYF